MKEQTGDMFDEYLSPEILYVITTNGYVKNDGRAVMGRGTAYEATQLQKGIDRILGDYILAWGNRPFLLPGNMASLPVKHHWKEKADVELISLSLGRLFDLWNSIGRPKLYLPRPGCGNGQLSWYHVRSLVESRFSGKGDVTIWSLGD